MFKVWQYIETKVVGVCVSNSVIPYCHGEVSLYMCNLVVLPITIAGDERDE